MARNDGIDRTVARNQDLETPDDVAKVQEHNEREKDSYNNQDIVSERTALNVHYKAPTDDYVKMFEQMEQDGVISTRGLKSDAVKYGELVFDVNSAYFYNHGGYEFAKQFYADAYRAAVEIAEKAEKIKYKQKFEQADKSAKIWKQRFEKLQEQYLELKQKVQPFLDAIEVASERVRAFVNSVLAKGKETQEHKAPARKRGQDMEI